MSVTQKSQFKPQYSQNDHCLKKKNLCKYCDVFGTYSSNKCRGTNTHEDGTSLDGQYPVADNDDDEQEEHMYKYTGKWWPIKGKKKFMQK
jgi:hypothetical protein